jgi:MoxR-like ATPase
MMNFNPLFQRLDQVLMGKPSVIRLSCACLLAGGHLLLEDLPGVGKTTLAHALAAAFGLKFSRVQFTSDLLPSDITGFSQYSPQNEPKFIAGPIFSNVLLADEINRASPKTQSALLEAMEEYQITVDGKSHALPTPFFVIATQNPSDQVGTFLLPESQRDRFLMCVSLGYPNRQTERSLLEGLDRRELISNLEAFFMPGQLLLIQKHISEIHASPHVLDYLQNLVETTRNDLNTNNHLSTRAVLGILRAAKATAAISGRDHVLPDDIQFVWVATTAHRLGNGAGWKASSDLMRAILNNVIIV